MDFPAKFVSELPNHEFFNPSSPHAGRTSIGRAAHSSTSAPQHSSTQGPEHPRYDPAVGSDYSIPSGAGIGHVHLKVADIDRALTFYRDLLGFTLVQRLDDQSAAFLASGDYHHHIALNTWLSRGSTPASPRHTGLFHLAIRYPTRRDLAVAVQRLIDAGVRIHGVADHGVSESIYLVDPDENGVELTWDRPREGWPRKADGSPALAMADPLDLEELLRMARDVNT
jgi:catechol 2,3-dioxygenase